LASYEYCSPQQIAVCGKYPFTIGQIRHLLLFRHRNGLQNSVRKVGKRLMFRMDLFEKWIEEQKEVKNA
jgi:hypothetical protein